MTDIDESLSIRTIDARVARVALAIPSPDPIDPNDRSGTIQRPCLQERIPLSNAQRGPIRNDKNDARSTCCNGFKKPWETEIVTNRERTQNILDCKKCRRCSFPEMTIFVDKTKTMDLLILSNNNASLINHHCHIPTFPFFEKNHTKNDMDAVLFGECRKKFDSLAEFRILQ